MSNIKLVYKQDVGPQDVEQLLALKDSVSSLRKRLRALEEAADVHEGRLVLFVEGGGSVEGFDLSVKVQERRVPSYRDWLLKLAGSEAVAKAIENTPPTVTKKLVITEAVDE